jgi:hypothetical protein
VTPGYRVQPGTTDRITCPADDPWAREEAEKGRTVYYNWVVNNPSCKFGTMGPDDRMELGDLLGKDRAVYHQGESVPSGSNYYEEYVARAEGNTPTVYGKPYWD